MIIIDEKSQPMRDVPPPYECLQPPSFPDAPRPPPPTLATLPPHILLQIIHQLFPQASDVNKGKVERQRETLYYLSDSLRLVNRVFYLASMHVLRSTYLPAYNALIRRPYSSDPFPHTLPNSCEPTASILTSQHVHRETKVLDLFIALRVRQDVYMDDTEFHLENTESFRDLFNFMQPKSRLEDLVCQQGAEKGVISGSEKVQPQRKVVSSQPQPVPYSALSVSFSTGKVSLFLATRTGKKPVAVVNWKGEERLEDVAKGLVSGLVKVLQERSSRFS